MIDFNKISTKHYIIILLVVSFAVHLIYFGYPNSVVFDEVHFGKFVSNYLSGEYYFDIHPPLGKLLISGVAKLVGFEPDFDFASIGDEFPNSLYIWLRLLPTIAGIILSVVIFLLAMKLGLSPIMSFVAGILVSLDNLFLVQSRFILLDLFLVLFGFLCLLFYFYFKDLGKYRYLLLSGLFGALSFSVKWTGATFLAMVIFLYAIDLYRYRKVSILQGIFSKRTLWLENLARGIGALIVLPALIYFLIFYLHFALLSKSGTGDAFMTPEFRKTLVGSREYGNPEISPKNIVGKFAEINVQMYKSNSGLSATHPYSSKWYSWPLMTKPIFYWSGDTEDPSTHSRIYLMGNPAIWWTSTIVVLIFSLLFIVRFLKHGWLGFKIQKTPAFLLGGYFFNLLPFALIGRVLFLYHYMSSYIFAILITVYMLDQKPVDQKINWSLVFVGFAISFFIYFAPLSYGTPLNEGAYNVRVWLSTWR
ncbi:MAG: hypothetical protein COV29_01150 [Candidatus Yanofskybacteria bacterium CG10_big_fil_rev_8_21_14_0_10_36_16]|uniref:Polyprenol-phosphate-mannose--protein mannosyltransferase n=1 Tax=Candidatus Yanofskybacteria bacterium CG10_big_fil_rev_8_21_14_0_10_36_16 TaxID=1975096 RepID=A0A2J0Q862_9BACT|nr:MAG: hypothetical protein COV29_01150 [Candidatus Yanofskybacteria bacterium CG10_big_fil_rev_8_21_14_0_10_36_16]